MNELIYKLFQYFISENVPDIKSVDLYFQQFEEQEVGQSDNLPNPRVLIEIGEFDEVEQHFGHSQVVQLPVTLHIGLDIYDGFNSNSSLLEANFKLLELVDTLFVQLNEITAYEIPEELQKQDLNIMNVTRTNQLLATNPGNIKISTMTFNILVEDFRTNKQTELTETTVESSTITSEINN
jgi:hypothetical protein